MDHRLTVRDACDDDLSALIAIKGAGSDAVHRDRLRDAREASFRYLVLLNGQEVIGFGCLVFHRPAYWSDAGDTTHLPQIVDVRIHDALQGQGYGTALMRGIERCATEAGAAEIYLSVAPLDNPRAYALYMRLGYQPLQPEPYRKTWEFTDSAGTLHQGDEWIIDMVKQL